jgi:hypothetical protein
MIDVTLSILALIGGGLTLELFGIAAPRISQNERAFQLGSDLPEMFEELQTGNPS